MRTINLIHNLSKMDQVLQNKIININDEVLTDPQYLELAGTLAKDYSNTSTYKIYTFCKYNNDVYSANTAILVPENFNANHWDLIGPVS